MSRNIFSQGTNNAFFFLSSLLVQYVYLIVPAEYLCSLCHLCNYIVIMSFVIQFCMTSTKCVVTACLNFSFESDISFKKFLDSYIQLKEQFLVSRSFQKGILPIAALRCSQNISKWMSETCTALKSMCRRREIISCGIKYFACICLFMRPPAFHVGLE